MSFSASQRFARTLGTFVLLGPLLGGLSQSIFILFETNWTSSTGPWWGHLPGLLGFVLLAVFFGFVLGILPAAITGMLCHLFAKKIERDGLWVFACASLGGSVSALAWVAWQNDFSASLAISGAMAAAGCALKLRRERWR